MARQGTEELVERLVARGPMGAADLRKALGISQPTFSRLVRAAGRKVVRIGRARSSLYAVARELRTLGAEWPVYRVGPDGRARHAANLHALQPREWWFASADPIPGWLHGEFANGIFPGLPWFIDDLRPQGFIGRAFAEHHADELGLSADPRNWSANDILTVLLAHSDDLPGDFVIGDASMERVQRTILDESPGAAIDSTTRAQRYAALADAAMAGEIPGSSAGGEQPKFAVCLEDAETFRHVLVKFSPPIDSPVGRRWADLLVCEHLAAEALRADGVSVSETRCLDGGGRAYLEVSRFDRVGRHGRKGFVTLMALDNAYYGKLDTWAAAADRMRVDGWLPEDDASTLRLLWWFGRLIGNTDLHFGNVSLALDHARPLRLAPAYDMLPMHYRPAATGEMPTRKFVPPVPNPQQLPTWRRALAIALAFWRRTAEDVRISAEFRVEAARIHDELRVLGERVG